MDPAVWAELERRADAVTDQAGTPIDAGIREVVVGLWAQRVATDYSCEGHIFDGADGSDPGYSAFAEPCVGIEAPAPDPHPLDVDPDEAGLELRLREQARLWRIQNYAMRARTLSLLERFYAGRAVPFHVRLQLYPTAAQWGTCRVSSTGAQATCVAPRPEQVARLTAYQAEMTAFGRFLRLIAP